MARMRDGRLEVVDAGTGERRWARVEPKLPAVVWLAIVAVAVGWGIAAVLLYGVFRSPHGVPQTAPATITMSAPGGEARG